MRDEVDRLLSEIQRSRLSERRTEPRHPFVRPVLIHFPHSPSLLAFSKDISTQGIGIICSVTMAVGSLATLEVHSIQGESVMLKSEVRWCDQYGKGWFIVGWKFIGIAVRPMA